MSLDAIDPAEHRSPVPGDTTLKKKKKKKKKHTDGQDDDARRTGSREKKRKRDTETEGRTKPSKKVRPDAETTSLTSPFHQQTSSFYLPLSPISQSHPVEGLCAEHLSPLILTYYPPFHAVIISYSNARLCERPTSASDNGERGVFARSIDEYAVSYVWVTADFLLFKPREGERIEGYINLQNEGHVGLVCWNLFNASIERKRLPKKWKWIAAGGVVDEDGATQENGQKERGRGEGHYVDGKGNKVEGMMSFSVRDVETSFNRQKGFLSIEGTTLDEEEERALAEKETLKASRGKAGKGKGTTNEGSAMSMEDTQSAVARELRKVKEAKRTE